MKKILIICFVLFNTVCYSEDYNIKWDKESTIKDETKVCYCNLKEITFIDINKELILNIETIKDVETEVNIEPKVEKYDNLLFNEEGN